MSPTVDSAVRKYFLMMVLVGFKINDEEDENLFWRSECVSLRLCCKKNVHSFSVDKCECYSADLGFGYLTLHCSALEEGAAKHFHSTLHFAKHFHSWRSPGIRWWSGVFRSGNADNWIFTIHVRCENTLSRQFLRILSMFVENTRFLQFSQLSCSFRCFWVKKLFVSNVKGGYKAIKVRWE